MSSRRIEMSALSVKTATGQGGEQAVANVNELLLFVDVTNITGTSPVLDVYVQSTMDGGTTWFDVAPVLTIDTSTNRTGGAVDADNRNVVTNLTAGTLRAAARYKEFGDLIRAAWVIGGTEVQATFVVKAVVKT